MPDWAVAVKCITSREGGDEYDARGAEPTAPSGVGQLSAGGEERRAAGGSDASERSRGFCFQAEDGIRDLTVTGVQTCALPIYHETGERVNRDLERSRERAAEEGQADAHQPLVGAQLEGDELARVGRGGQADHERVVGGGTQHTRGDVGDFHGRLAASSGVPGRHPSPGCGATTTGGGGATKTCRSMTVGRATTARSECPKMPVPEMIWLNTANAPRPRAASAVEYCGSSGPLDGGCRAPIYGRRFLTTMDACGATRGATRDSGPTTSRDAYRQPNGADGSWMASR